MSKDLNASLSKLSKKRLNILDIVKLYKLFKKLPDDIACTKQFLNNYYGINNFPDEFYILFINSINSDSYKKLFHILCFNSIFKRRE